MNKNIVVDVDETLIVMRMIFTNGTGDQIEEILDGIESLREEFGYGAEVTTSELLADVVGKGLVNFTNDLEDYVNDEWIPIGKASKDTGISVSTLSRRIDDGDLSVQRRGPRKLKFVLANEVNQVKLKKPATHTGPRPKKQKRANDAQVAQRTSVVMDVLSDGKGHTIREVIDALMERSDFSFNKDQRDTAYKLIAKLIKSRKISWQASNGNSNPRVGDTVFLPMQQSLFKLKQRSFIKN